MAASRKHCETNLGVFVARSGTVSRFQIDFAWRFFHGERYSLKIETVGIVVEQRANQVTVYDIRSVR